MSRARNPYAFYHTEAEYERSTEAAFHLPPPEDTADGVSGAGFLVTADDFSTIKLFNYPVVADDAPYKAFRGHASHVTSVRCVRLPLGAWARGVGERGLPKRCVTEISGMLRRGLAALIRLGIMYIGHWQSAPIVQHATGNKHTRATCPVPLVQVPGGRPAGCERGRQRPRHIPVAHLRRGVGAAAAARHLPPPGRVHDQGKGWGRAWGQRGALGACTA